MNSSLIHFAFFSLPKRKGNICDDVRAETHPYDYVSENKTVNVLIVYKCEIISDVPPSDVPYLLIKRICDNVNNLAKNLPLKEFDSFVGF